MKTVCNTGCVLYLIAYSLSAQNPETKAASAADYLRVTLANDLNALRQFTHETRPQISDTLGWTPLHYAALFGTPEALRVVLDAGADPNARNLAQATPLLFAAYNFEKTRLLVEKGADVNTKTKNGSTALWVAAGAPGNERTVRYLLEKGADPKVVRPDGSDLLIRAAPYADASLIRLLLQKGLDPQRASKSGDTALIESFFFRRTANARLLREAGANVNAATTDAGTVKNGPIDLIGLTPLMLAAAVGGHEEISGLIKAGAQVNAVDHRNMTALMMTVAMDDANPANVQLLINAGSDLNVADRYGDTALDWARKYGNPEVIAALEKAGARGKSLPPAPSKPADYKPGAREATNRASLLLAKSSEEFFPAGGGCVGCHHQPFAARAFGAVAGAGLRADPQLRKMLIDGLVTERPQLINALPLLNQGGGGVDTLLYQLAGMAEIGEPATSLMHTMVHYIATQQDPSGEWINTAPRPPLQSSSITTTMLAITALKTYGWPARRVEFDARIARARAWLLTAQTVTTVEEADRLMGLYLAGAERKDLKMFAQKLLEQQREDGGWAQTRYLHSDAFGTAAALCSLHKAGFLQLSDRAYQRGTQFLLNTQFPDGSWFVRSRAVKLQPYFQSAFPFDHDQWISNSATAYAVMALAPVAAEEQTTARR